MRTFYLTVSRSSTVDEKEASYYNRLMNLFTIKNLSKSYTDKVLFDDADLSLEEGEKVGVVGINGTGKSTLLKKEYDSIEQDISDLEANICELDRKLSEPSISTDFAKLSEIAKEKEDTNTLLEQKMERYYYLEDLNEKITRQG